MRAEYLGEIARRRKMIKELGKWRPSFWQSGGVAVGDQRIADVGRVYRDHLIAAERQTIARLQMYADLSARG